MCTVLTLYFLKLEIWLIQYWCTHGTRYDSGFFFASMLTSWKKRPHLQPNYKFLVKASLTKITSSTRRLVWNHCSVIWYHVDLPSNSFNNFYPHDILRHAHLFWITIHTPLPFCLDDTPPCLWRPRALRRDLYWQRWLILLDCYFVHVALVWLLSTTML